MLNNMKILTLVTALSLLCVGLAPTVPVQAVTTTSDSSEIHQSFTSEWVKQIDQALQSPQLSWTFLYDPRNPRSEMLKALNQAAEAMNGQNPAKAKELVNTAFTILEEGNRLGYYSQSQVEAVKKTITQHFPSGLA
jgi:hypothetical protein